MTTFIVIYETDSGEESFVEFGTWEDAYRWCQDAIERGTSRCALHWVSKTETYRVQHLRKMVSVP